MADNRDEDENVPDDEDEDDSESGNKSDVEDDGEKDGEKKDEEEGEKEGNTDPMGDEDDGADDNEDENGSITDEKRAKRLTTPGIIYLSRIPEHMSVKKVRQIFGEYGELDRIFLQPDEKDGRRVTKKRSFTEGWIEFSDRRVAKRVAAALNNQRIGGKRRSRWCDELWNVKYLRRFQWTHLNERLAYERAVHRQRMRTEVAQVKREMTHFVNTVEKRNILERLKKKRKTSDVITKDSSGLVSQNDRGMLAFRQKQTDDELQRKKQKSGRGGGGAKQDRTVAALDKDFLRGLFSGGGSN